MDSDRELVLAIVMGLRTGLALCHGMRRKLTEEEQFKVGLASIHPPSALWFHPLPCAGAEK